LELALADAESSLRNANEDANALLDATRRAKNEEQTLRRNAESDAAAARESAERARQLSIAAAAEADDYRCVLYKSFSPIARFQQLISSPFN
jgi:hypothetical protein